LAEHSGGRSAITTSLLPSRGCMLHSALCPAAAAAAAAFGARCGQRVRQVRRSSPRCCACSTRHTCSACRCSASRASPHALHLGADDHGGGFRSGGGCGGCGCCRSGGLCHCLCHLHLPDRPGGLQQGLQPQPHGLATCAEPSPQECCCASVLAVHPLQQHP
jgi:hypothetical protein